MKKTILLIVIMLIIVSLGVGGYYIFNNKNNSNNDQNSQENNNEKNNTTSKKILVVYYSATGSTKKVAKEIAQNLDADLFEIEPVDTYTSADLDWTDSNSRVTKEHNDESLRNVELKNNNVNNWDSYDMILIGYPIWWGIAAWPVNNFVKDNDFTGKTVIPFCTSASSGLGESSNLLEDLAGTGNWKLGHRFSSNASSSDIKAFTDSIN